MSPKVVWTTPTDLTREIRRLWERGRILAAQITGEPVFPLRLPLRRPDAKAMAERFDEVRSWIRALDEGSRDRRGFGYAIEWQDINHRQLGRNRIPAAVSLPTEGDALRLIGKVREAEGFRELTRQTEAQFPVLLPWLAKRPLRVMEHAGDWDRILAVLAWFKEHPNSNLYLRQIDIPNVDTKFLEVRKGLISELLDLVLSTSPEENPAQGVARFEERYGLCAKPPLVRFRLLDDRLAIHGFSDLTVPVSEFARFAPQVRHVFVTENEINGLAFPAVSKALVIFGLGYGIDLLGTLSWMHDCGVYYWGDIDTHGFRMLDQLRARFPGLRSLLMDRETLMLHRRSWGSEPVPYLGELSHLNEDEAALYDDLRFNRLGESVRLEQERISFSWLQERLKLIMEEVQAR
jgi:hypothetical protein